MKKTIPYEKLSLIYDNLMSHVNYKNWAKYIQNLFHFAENDIHKIIDVSCGTGSLLSFINQKKYSCYGSDISFPMVYQAKKKITKNIFLNSDSRNMALKSQSIDAVIFLYDSLNYLQDKNQLNQLFSEVNRILVNGGIFIFDIITELLCRTHYKNFEEEENWGHIGYIRHSYYNEKKHIQHNDFRIKIDGEIFFENHIQKVYSEEQIASVIDQSNFKIVGQFDNFTFVQSNDDSERIHYVCIKKENRND
jgi:ubiquinone/menaquinone biosynthesis C-methylase UbiE